MSRLLRHTKVSGSVRLGAFVTSCDQPATSPWTLMARPRLLGPPKVPRSVMPLVEWRNAWKLVAET